MNFYPDKLRAARKSLGLSMHEVASKMNITWQTIWNWENGKTIPSEPKIRLLCQATGINVQKFSNLEPEAPISDANLATVVEPWFSFVDSEINEEIQKSRELARKVLEQGNKLNKSSILLKNILNAMNTIFYIKDTELKYIIANDAFKKNISLPALYSPKGLTDKDFFSKNEAINNENLDYTVITSGIPIKNLENYIPGSKKKKWGITFKIPIFDSQNKIAGLIGYFVDITERKKAENMRSMLEICIESINDGIIIYTFKSGKIIYANHAALDILNITAESLKETNFYKCFLSSTHPSFQENERKMRDSKLLPERREIMFSQSDNKIIWLEIKERIVEFSGIEYGFMVMSDITENKKNRAILELLKLNIDSMPDGLSIQDIETFEYIYLNKAIETLYGTTVEILYKKGRDYWLNNIVIDADRELINKNIKKKKITYRVKTTSGDLKWIESTATIDTYMGKKCLISIERDITNTKILSANQPPSINEE